MVTTKAIRGALIAAALVVAQGAQAQDSNRIDQLEKEVLTLKQRLSKIESMLGRDAAVTAAPKPEVAGDGWKTLAAWRQLKKGMPPDQVRGILGEPSKVNGGAFTHWFYANGGGVTFYHDKLDSWSEP